MMTLTRPILAALAASAAMLAITPAQAQAPFGGDGSASIYNYDHYMISTFRDRMAKMSGEDRSRAMAMMDRIMQMEHDHQMARAKLQAGQTMELAKARRELEMFLAGIGSAAGR